MDELFLFDITKFSKNWQSSCYLSELLYYLFIFEYSPGKVAIFRPLMIAEASSLGLTKGFALGPYQGAFVPCGPLH